MAEIRTPDVDDLLSVLAALDDPDAIFALLEDLFTVAWRGFWRRGSPMRPSRRKRAPRPRLSPGFPSASATAPAATSKRSKFWMRARSGCAETGTR